MRIVTFLMIEEFIEKHPCAEIAMKDWFFIMQRGDWSSLEQMKKDFADVDQIGNNLYSFSIDSHNYLLIIKVFFESKKVYVCFIGNYCDYIKLEH